MGNITKRENTLLRGAVAALGRRLPPGWSVAIRRDAAFAPEGGADALVDITSPDGRGATLSAQVKQRLDPRGAGDLIVLAARSTRPTLAIAPWMSAGTRERLSSAGVQLLDLTGNARVVLSAPGLFIETAGAERDPSPERRRATLKGEKAGRLVRALCLPVGTFGVRALATAAHTTPGYTSKIVSMLDEEGLVVREAGRVTSVDLARLLGRWAADAPLSERAHATTWLDPRGLSSLLERLRGTSAGYALTGSFAASRKAPVASPRLASLYVEDPEDFAATLGLRPAEAGANVTLLAPEDDLPYQGTWKDEGLCYAALPQVAADLLSGPGRGPAEAAALIDWMTANPEVCRG
jgi:hypothetical protein